MKGYGFGEDQVQSSKGFPLSECVENVSLGEAQYVSGETKKGDPYQAIELVFTRPDGGRLQDRMFEVNEENVEPRNGLSLEESIKKEYLKFNTRLWHFADAFGVDRQEMTDACTGHKNFKSFANAYSKLLSETAAGKTVIVKTIRAKGGFINLPMFPTFIQSSEKDCTLEWSDWERKANKKNARPERSVEGPEGSAQTAAPSGGEDVDEDWLEDDGLDDV